MLEAKYNKPFEPIIYAVTKETPTDTRAIRIQNVDAMQNELNELAQNIKRLDAVKKAQNHQNLAAIANIVGLIN